MKTREFDPVRSAALRNELEARASAPSDPRPHPRSRLRRPQVWVTAVTALVLLVATVGVLRLTPTHEPQPARTAQVVDPLTRIMDPDDPEYIEGGVLPLLHLSGTGAGTYALDVPEGTTSVRPLIACSPAADFRITVGLAYWTGCDREGSPGYADTPVSPGVQPIAVQVPDGVRWRLVVIETPGKGTTSSTLRVTGAASTPASVIRYPAPEQEEDVPVGIASGGAGTTTGRLFAPVDELALVTSCSGSGGLVITMSDGLQIGTDAAPLPCGSPAKRSATALSNDRTAGYRSEGRLRWTARAVGDVRWTATFSSRTVERLPYPAVSGSVLGRVRGSSSESFGALAHDAARVHVTVTCRGAGGLTVVLRRGAQDLARPRAVACSSGRAARSEYVVTVPAATASNPERLSYSVEPRGDVLWTATFTAG